MNNDKEKIIINDDIKELIAKIVSETVSKVMKESMAMMLSELERKQEKNKNFDREVARAIKVNKSKLVESKIYELIKNEGMLLSNLKFLIVDQLQYCSKASFYRHVDNLKNKGLIIISETNNKKFVLKKLSVKNE